MSDGVLPQNSQPSGGGLLAARTGVKKDKRAARRAFWRTLALVWPHRRAMIWGMVLGFGVALTYAASLGGLYPVLRVITEKNLSFHDYLLGHVAPAEVAEGHPAEKTGMEAGPTGSAGPTGDAGHATATAPPGSAAPVATTTPAGAREAGAADAPVLKHRWYTPYLRYLAPLFPAGTSPGERMRALLILLGVLFGLNFIGNICRVLSQYLVLYATHRSLMDLRRRMYRKALRVPLNDLTGDVSTRVNQFLSDTREIYLGITTLFGKVAREPLKAIAVLTVALVLDARLTLIVLAVVPPAVGILWYFGRKVRKAVVRLLEGYADMLRSLEETLQGADVVKGYGREGYERRQLWGVERRMMKQMLKLAWIEALASPMIEVIGILITAAGIVWLASRTFQGEIEAGRFLAMVVLLAAMLDPVRKIANVYNMVQRAGAAATRVWDFLDQPEEVSTPRPRRLSGDGPRAVRMEEVTFRYTPTQEPPALADVTLDVRPGESLAIVGPNGSGKSTLLKLLPRLLEPDAGRVRIDGVDLRDLSLRRLRLEIAVVTQRPVIFARSVFDNIAYGKRGATLDEVRAAARRAYAADFIEAWPQQYETKMGEFGTSVSGGQRQRIAIARAFLKPASILIFDEATSEIDAESEHKIHEALDELRQGKTTFLIAHRHTVMDMAQRVVVMDQGRIVDVGTRDELLERCPLFVALYRSPVGVGG